MADKDEPPGRMTSEFLCPGCGQPLALTLRSTMCFAEAQVYCDACERDYQEGRGKWAERPEQEGRIPFFRSGNCRAQ